LADAVSFFTGAATSDLAGAADSCFAARWEESFFTAIDGAIDGATGVELVFFAVGSASFFAGAVLAGAAFTGSAFFVIEACALVLPLLAAGVLLAAFETAGFFSSVFLLPGFAATVLAVVAFADSAFGAAALDTGLDGAALAGAGFDGAGFFEVPVLALSVLAGAGFAFAVTDSFFLVGIS